MGIVVIPSSIFLAESIRGASKSEDVMVAVNLARMEMERINNLPYDHPDLDLKVVTLPRYRNYNYDLVRTVVGTVAVVENFDRGGRGDDHRGGRGAKESAKEIKIEVYPARKLASASAGKLRSDEDLLTTVITHRAENVE